MQVIKKFADIIDWRYFIRFLLIFLPLYFINNWYWGLVDPKNYYSAFLDENLNYFTVLTGTILGASNILLHVIGLPTVVAGKFIYIPDGTSLLMDVPCIGLGIMFFWIAFMAAGKSTARHKFKWITGGLIAIWIINCLRVTILMYSLEKDWNFGKNIDAHDLFNYAAYAVIALLIWLESKSNKLEPIEEQTTNLVPGISS